MDDSTKLATVQDYLRITYSGDGVGLKALIQNIAQKQGALEAVTITGDSYEGESHHGQLALDPLLYLRAAMDVLKEIAPTLVPDAPVSGALTDFSRTIVGT